MRGVSISNHYVSSPRAVSLDRCYVSKVLIASCADDPETYAGAPITVQLVCKRFREEECIGLGGVVADALKAAMS